jgi:hypothetical protein
MDINPLCESFSTNMQGYNIFLNNTAIPLVFLMLDSSNHLTGMIGLAPTVTLSKAGGAFAACAGAITEIGNGWYQVAGNSTDASTRGPLLLHATAPGADPVDMIYYVDINVNAGIGF